VLSKARRLNFPCHRWWHGGVHQLPFLKTTPSAWIYRANGVFQRNSSRRIDLVIHEGKVDPL
jgi:hypothetical protein